MDLFSVSFTLPLPQLSGHITWMYSASHTFFIDNRINHNSGVSASSQLQLNSMKHYLSIFEKNRVCILNFVMYFHVWKLVTISEFSSHFCQNYPFKKSFSLQRMK